MEDHKRALALLYDALTIALAWYALAMLAQHVGGFKGGLGAPFWALKEFKTHWPNWWVFSVAGCAIVGALVFGLNPFRGAGEYGKARWAEEKEIKAMGLRESNGVVLGQRRGRFLRYSAPLSTIVCAPPDSGKTAGIVIPTGLSCGDSMVQVDVKGELYKKTAPRRAKFSKVVRIAPGEEGGDGWNPLAASELPKKWADVEIAVDRVASVLYAPGLRDDPYFLPAGRSLFIMFALYLIDRKGETSIPAVREFAMSLRDVQLELAAIADEKGVPGRVRQEAIMGATMASRQWSGVWGQFTNRLEVFADPRVADNFSRSDFSLSQLRRERTSVYLQVKPNDIPRLGRCLTLFLECAGALLLSTEPEPQEHGVTFVLDEFPRLPPMDTMINLPALSRSYRVRAIYIIQAWSQVVDTYGPEKAKTLKNTCAYQVFFAQTENTIAQMVSADIGPRTRRKFSFSSSETRWTRNTSETSEGVPLVTVQDVMSMKSRQIIVLVKNHFETPIKATDACWYKDRGQRELVPRALHNAR